VVDQTAIERRIGNVIAGKYEIQRVLGIGSTGAVYEAWHRFTDRPVAVKILHEHMLGNREAVGRFMREARAASAIGHPSIVTILDAGVTQEGPPYMVQELLQGHDLETAIEHQQLTWSDVMDIGAQLLDGLAAAHERDIVHRDIKPQNVFLLEGEGGRRHQVKLVDFGVAKALDGGRMSAALTLPGATVGTPYYMSPEQAKADPVDTRTDIWSVGAVLYHVSTGSPPFHSEKSLADLLVKIVMGDPPRVRDTRQDIPPQLAEAIDRAMQKSPDERWPTAAAMAEHLRKSDASIGGLDWDDD